VQCDVSGVVDHRHADDAACLAMMRRQFAQLARPAQAPFARREPAPPLYDQEELYGIMPADRTRPYDIREVLARLLDGSEIDEYKPTYGQTLVCGTGWIEGWPVGVVANQRSVVQRATGTGDRELQIGGVIYSDSADKGARFVELCNQKGIPLLFIQDVTGFMVGSRAERGGIIKDGAKMVNAVANSTVPKITLFVGNSYGAGNYAMCGKAYGARFLYAWPSAASWAVNSGSCESTATWSGKIRTHSCALPSAPSTKRVCTCTGRSSRGVAAPMPLRETGATAGAAPGAAAGAAAGGVKGMAGALGGVVMMPATSASRGSGCGREGGGG